MTQLNESTPLQLQKENKIIIAIVGMPGAGKSKATRYLEKKGIPFVRFGDITDEAVKESGLPLNEQNEKTVREKLRKELGMGAYAYKSEPKIEQLLKENEVVVLDGLYSWEEYTYLKKKFPNLILIHIFAEPGVRYKRLCKREIRPVKLEESRERDITELEKLNKGGPIAIADYLIENNSDSLEDLYKKIDNLLTRLEIKL